MDRHARAYVTGPETLIGSAIVRALKRRGCENLVAEGETEPELTDAGQVDRFFAETKPDYVFLSAGKSGGITANQKYPADLMLHNLQVECAVVEGAYRNGVTKLLYLASSCSYPRQCPQPMREEYILTGRLEPTNEAYAVAKIAGITLCQAFRSQYGADFVCVIPANVFGPADDFSLEDSHVVAALIRRMHEAKLRGDPEIVLWGSGSPRRDFIYADDLADACCLIMEAYDQPEPINVGSGVGMTIAELAEAIRETTGFEGAVRFDPSKPDGMPVKILDCRKVHALRWRPATPLADALAATYAWYRQTAREREAVTREG